LLAGERPFEMQNVRPRRTNDAHFQDGRRSRCGSAVGHGATWRGGAANGVRTQSSRGQGMAQDEKGAMLGAYADFLDRVCPRADDLRGRCDGRSMIAMAKARGMSVFSSCTTSTTQPRRVRVRRSCGRAFGVRAVVLTARRSAWPAGCCRWWWTRPGGGRRAQAAVRDFVIRPRKGSRFCEDCQCLRTQADIPLLLVEGIWGKKALAGLGMTSAALAT